ncbi:MAG TPA: aldehyde dehydrogenase family protein [Planctomycetota bacterium]|nr:aldehyde dehydrogenase family protein [Planctomycetota bacterium]
MSLMMAENAVGLHHYRNFIDGQWVQSMGTRRAYNINPADIEDKIGEVTLATREETKAAIEAARRAFPAWKATPAPTRGRLIAKVREVLERRKEEIARLLTREEGKILREARGEVQKTLNMLDFMSGEGYRMGGETAPSELPNTACYTLRQPLGVVSIITPWNFPLCIPAWKIAPALVAGNTVVFKPATLTPGTATALVECFVEAGLPKGVLNMVIGSGSEVGDELVANPTIRAVSFTGSNEIGTALYVQAAKTLKKVQCEMGGKNPIVVLEDADLDLAAEATVQGAFGSTGQRCTATSRAVVMDSVADAFVAKLAEKAKKIVLGSGLDEKTGMGPSVDEGQHRTVLNYIEVAKQDGAKLVCGGTRPAEGALARGYFTTPTVFDHVTPGMRIAKEEVFGPVLAVIRVKSFEEACEVANDCEYGLTSSLYTHDVSKWYKFVDAIETGITHLNSPTMGGEPQLPFGGMKATGVGSREMGKPAIDFFTELKTVYADYTGRKRETNIY